MKSVFFLSKVSFQLSIIHPFIKGQKLLRFSSLIFDRNWTDFNGLKRKLCPLQVHSIKILIVTILLKSFIFMKNDQKHLRKADFMKSQVNMKGKALWGVEIRVLYWSSHEIKKIIEKIQGVFLFTVFPFMVFKLIKWSDGPDNSITR